MIDVDLYDLGVTAAQGTFVGAAARIRLAVSSVNPSVSGQVEAAVMANDLVRFIQQEETSSGVFSRVVLNEAKGGPSNTIINGVRDAGMAVNIQILHRPGIPLDTQLGTIP